MKQLVRGEVEGSRREKSLHQLDGRTTEQTVQVGSFCDTLTSWTKTAKGGWKEGKGITEVEGYVRRREKKKVMGRSLVV
jgi:hypothetical protein